MKNNWIIALFGLSLYFLVMTVLYTIINLDPENTLPKSLEVFAPFVVLSGFFIFLIGAMLVALAIFNHFYPRHYASM
jgi:hypothetical protein